MRLPAFQSEWEAMVASPMTGLSPQERRYRHYSRYNLERYTRVKEAYEPSKSFMEAIARVQEPQTWLFLTEYWCADAAYSQPIVEAAAEAHGKVDLRFLLRDQNLDVMERYLTVRARSIPILAVFDASGAEVFRWGSKPASLAALRARLKGEGADERAISAATIEWYENEGWLEVENELTEHLAALKRAA